MWPVILLLWNLLLLHLLCNTPVDGSSQGLLPERPVLPNRESKIITCGKASLIWRQRHQSRPAQPPNSGSTPGRQPVWMVGGRHFHCLYPALTTTHITLQTSSAERLPQPTPWEWWRIPSVSCPISVVLEKNSYRMGQSLTCVNPYSYGWWWRVTWWKLCRSKRQSFPALIPIIRFSNSFCPPFHDVPWAMKEWCLGLSTSYHSWSLHQLPTIAKRGFSDKNWKQN